MYFHGQCNLSLNVLGKMAVIQLPIPNSLVSPTEWSVSRFNSALLNNVSWNSFLLQTVMGVNEIE